MKINDSHLDEKTTRLFKKTNFDEPSKDFAFNIMQKVKKEKAYGKRSYENLWQILVAVGLPVIYFVYRYLTGGTSVFTDIITGLKTSSYFEFIRIISDGILQDITLSPIVLLGIAAILLLLAFDRIILKLIHS